MRESNGRAEATSSQWYDGMPRGSVDRSVRRVQLMSPGRPLRPDRAVCILSFHRRSVGAPDNDRLPVLCTRASVPFKLKETRGETIADSDQIGPTVATRTRRRRHVASRR
jgi:hypothetical protein